MEPDPVNELTDDQLADLARLADGTLPEERRAEIEREFGPLVERQNIALAALRGTTDTGAPARLRANVERQRSGGRARDVRRFRVIGGVAAVAAAALLGLVLGVPGGVSGGPSVATAAALGTKPPTAPAPGGVPGTPQLLAANVDDVPFPNYAAKFGWKPVGRRSDDPKGRDATTVYYEKDGRRIAYTIVS